MPTTLALKLTMPTGGIQRPGERVLGRDHVAPLADQCVDEVALPVDRPVQGAPAPVDVDVRLVRVARGARCAAPLGPRP